MEYKAQERIRTEVSAVLLLIDDFTDRPLTSIPARVTANGYERALRKPEGYYVFTNLREAEAIVNIQAPAYLPQRLTLDLGKLQSAASSLVVKVRVKPGQGYSFPEGTTCLEGKTEPGARVWVCSEDGNGTKKLLYDYEKGSSTISVYCPEKEELEGRAFFIAKDLTNGREEIRLKARCEEGELKSGYVLEHPLNHPYKKIGTKLYSIYETEADDQGRYFLPVKGGGKEASFLCGWEKGEQGGEQLVSLQPGQRRKMDFLTEEG